MCDSTIIIIVTPLSLRVQHLIIVTLFLQVKQVRKGKLCSLKPPKLLKDCQFEHELDSAAVPKLITLSPLFPCLNH